MAVTYYPAIIDRSASGFGISFPDFPGCVAWGGTVQEAAVNGEAALALHVEAMGKDGDSIPAPSNIEDIEDVDGAEDIARLLVRVNAPAKVTRILVSMDQGLVDAIDAATNNRSAFIADAARSALQKRAHA